MGLSYTYNSMVASLQDWNLDSNADFVAALPEIINKGELMVQRDIDLNILDDQQNATITIAVATVPKPTNLVRERLVHIASASRTLKKVTLDFIRSYSGAAAAVPKYYADLDETSFIVAPTPVAGYTAEVHGIYRPNTLVDAGTTNTTWLSTRYPDLLWKACQIAACEYLKKWKLRSEIQAEYKELLPSARSEAKNQMRADPEDVHTKRVHGNPPGGSPPAEQT